MTSSGPLTSSSSGSASALDTSVSASVAVHPSTDSSLSSTLNLSSILGPVAGPLSSGYSPSLSLIAATPPKVIGPTTNITSEECEKLRKAISMLKLTKLTKDKMKWHVFKNILFLKLACVHGRDLRPLLFNSHFTPSLAPNPPEFLLVLVALAGMLADLVPETLQSIIFSNA